MKKKQSFRTADPRLAILRIWICLFFVFLIAWRLLNSYKVGKKLVGFLQSNQLVGFLFCFYFVAVWFRVNVWERIKQWVRPGFDSWVGKARWRREGLPTSVFWPGEFHGLYSPWGGKESDTTEQLSLSLFKVVSVVIRRRKMEKHHGWPQPWK